MMKQKIVKSVFAVFLAAALALSAGAWIACGAAGVLAYDHPSTGGEEKALYYFSDHEGCSEVYEDLCEAGLFTEGALYYYDVSEDEDAFEQTIINYFESGEYDGIENSYVIFEKRYPFIYVADNGSVPLFTDTLYEFFAMLQENGCDILFICGTDEIYFSRYNEFLDCANAHINMDLSELFFANVFWNFVEDNNYSTQVENVTFVFDHSLSGDIGMADSWYHENWFFDIYFIPFIRNAYMEEIIENDEGSRTLFENHGIKIYCHRGGDAYYDLVSDEEITENDLVEKGQNEHVYFVGTTFEGMEYAEGWVDDAAAVRESMQAAGARIYLYSDEYFFTSLPNFYTAGIATDIYPVLEDFISGADMSVYDNFGGRCVVTHKPVASGPNGWMIDVYGEAEEEGISLFGDRRQSYDILPGSDKYMDDDNTAFLYNYPSDW